MRSDYAYSAGDAGTLDGYDSTEFSLSAHEHDERYYTESESDDRYVDVSGDAMSGSSGGALLSVTNNSSEAETIGVYARATATGDVNSYGGYFVTDANWGCGIFAEATATEYVDAKPSCGGYFRTAGILGRAVYGEATGEWEGGGPSYGGYFTSENRIGTAVYGEATSTHTWTNTGGYFKAAGGLGHGVYAMATHDGNYTNYGGNFSAWGESGIGVCGTALNDANSTNYGGRFTAHGQTGVGVYGEAFDNADSTNYGGYFKAAGEDGRAVYGKATATARAKNYGGFFESYGDIGRGVYAYAEKGYGVYGDANGTSGRGVYGKASGDNGVGVFGLSSGGNGAAVKGLGSGGSKAGYFEGDVLCEGDVHVTGEITKAFTAGTSNQAAPVAYATINSDGSKATGTPNVSSAWNGTDEWYEITIAGEPYFWSWYSTVVTARAGAPCIATTDSGSNKLIVRLWDTSGSAEQGDFQFVTYKP